MKNISNKKVISDIRRMKNKIYKEFEKLLNRYGVMSEENFYEAKIKSLETENKMLKQDIDMLTKELCNNTQLVSNKSDVFVTENKTNSHVDLEKLNKYLNAVGKGVFEACYDVIAKNYNKNHDIIKKSIEEYGLKKGEEYTKKSISSRTSKSCAIFKEGWEKEALEICKNRK